MVKIPVSVLEMFPKPAPKVVPSEPEVAASEPDAIVPPLNEPPARITFPNAKLCPANPTLPPTWSVPVVESEAPDNKVAFTPLWMSNNGVRTGAWTFKVRAPEPLEAMTEVPAMTEPSNVMVPLLVGWSRIWEYVPDEKVPPSEPPAICLNVPPARMVLELTVVPGGTQPGRVTLVMFVVTPEIVPLEMEPPATELVSEPPAAITKDPRLTTLPSK
jgi:hypothetical protein